MAETRAMLENIISYFSFFRVIPFSDCICTVMFTSLKIIYLLKESIVSLVLSKFEWVTFRFIH